MSCLDDVTLMALVHGELDSGRLAAADEHLDGCADCRALVLCLARGADAEAGTRPSSPDAGAPLGAGRTLGRYVVLGRAGAGGMGDVYAAWDPELGRRVAVKVLRSGPGLEDGDARRARTLREAQAMARLTHPGVVAVYEVGTDGDAIFIAMEWVAGRTLRAWFTQGGQARPWRAVRDAFLVAGAALAAAHRAGLVHRDFKPDNVFVDDGGAVKVGDFGLARLGEARDAGAAPALALTLATPSATTLDLTRTGAVVGTPAYMAPEQLDGRPADARSDQFAFAASLWEGVYGQRPFVAADLAGLRAAHRAGPPTPPSGRAPAWLAEVLARALAVDPARRFGDLDALLHALRHDQRARARRVGLLTVAAIVVVGAGAYVAGRVPGAAAGAGAAAVVDPCAGGAAAFGAVWSPARRDAIGAAFAATAAPGERVAAARVDSEVERRRTAWIAGHRDACTARTRGEASPALADARMHCLSRRRGELDALLDVFERADRDAVLGARDALGALPDESECAGVAPLAAAEARPTSPEGRRVADALEAELAAARAQAATGAWAATRARADELAQRAEAASWRVLAGEAHLLAAQLARRAGRFDDADAAAHAALKAAEGGRDDLGAVRAELELVAVAAERGRWDDAELWLRAADAALERAARPPRLVATWRHLRGQLALERGRFDDAERELTAALGDRRRLLGEGHPEVARTLTAMGNLARARGDLRGALAAHDEALAIDTAALGEAHPGLARHHHNRGGVLRLMGRPDDARAAYARALVLERAGHGDAHPALGLTENSLGLVELDLGHDAAAAAHFERALLRLAEHPDRAAALHNLGLVAARRGDHAGAIARFEAALPLYLAQVGASHKRTAYLRIALGGSRAAQGDRAGARIDLDAAVAAAEAAGLPELAAEARAARAEVDARPVRPVRPLAGAAAGVGAGVTPPPLPSPPPARPPRAPTNASTYVPATTWDSD